MREPDVKEWHAAIMLALKDEPLTTKQLFLKAAELCFLSAEEAEEVAKDMTAVYGEKQWWKGKHYVEGMREIIDA